MKLASFGATIGAVFALQVSLGCAKHSHQHIEAIDRRHRHHNREAYTSKVETGSALELRAPADVSRRDGQCQFPTDAGLVSVAPNDQNAGWAMSPDQPCLPGHYCPYACPPGQMMAQWDPNAIAYEPSMSMNGGLYCDNSGQIHKPFPDKPYCMTGNSNIGALNKAGKHVAFCQTVLPGNEAMLIPTGVESWAQLANPTTEYWCKTAAHYYINFPGTSCETACVWGTHDNPWGNWSPYVAGANTVDNGETFLKLGWNPIWLEPQTPFKDTMPNFGVEIVCDGDGCNGLPCAIDPNVNKVNEMVGTYTTGAGGATFCVVTVPKGVNANFVIHGSDSNSASGGSGGGNSSPPSSSAAPSPPSPLSLPSPTPSSTPPPSTTPASTSSVAPSSSSPSGVSSVSSGDASSTTSGPSSASGDSLNLSYSPHVLLENLNSTATVASASGTGSSGGAVTAQTTAPHITMSQIANATPTAAGYRAHATAAGLSLTVLAAFIVIAL